MRRAASLLAVLAFAGCGAAFQPVPRRPVAPPRAWLPSSPARWPPYPRFPAASCWTRPAFGRVLRVAPSFARVQRASPRAIAHRVLAGLGDRHFVRSIAFGPPPPISRQHTGYFGPGRHPPRNAIWAYLGAAESESFVGGFRVVSLWLLRPLERAPLLVVETDRDRKSFVADVPSIVDWLDSRNGAAVTFEGFLLEARDAKGPFARVENVERGEAEGGQWSADPCDYPYAHSGPLSLRGNPC